MPTMLTLEALKTELGETDYTDKRLAEVLAAERAAQRSYVDAPSPRPEELDKALLARVQHSLEIHGADAELTRVGIDGPGVRDLEAPYRRRRTAEQIAAAEAARSAPSTRARKTAKRAAKRASKTTAKRAAARATSSGSDA